jgi:hypothetical protein
MLAISRALLSRPALMLMDEPSLGLSPLLTQEIFRIITRINREKGTTILLVEQNANMALEVADYGYVLEVGRIVMEDTCKRLLEKEDVQEFYLGMKAQGVRGQRRWKKNNGDEHDSSVLAWVKLAPEDHFSPEGLYIWKSIADELGASREIGMAWSRSLPAGRGDVHPSNDQPRLDVRRPGRAWRRGRGERHLSDRRAGAGRVPARSGSVRFVEDDEQLDKPLEVRTPSETAQDRRFIGGLTSCILPVMSPACARWARVRCGNPGEWERRVELRRPGRSRNPVYTRAPPASPRVR